jgi:ParB family chromosome partitioning protein
MTPAKIDAIKPAVKNARVRSERGAGMIARSITENGFGRSVLLANDGSLIAGSGTIDASAEVGLEDVIIVPSDGTKIIAVQRTDVAPGSERAHRLAIADNRTTDLSDFDPAVIAELSAEVDLSDFWRADELDALLASMPDADEWGAALGGLPDGDKQPFQQMTFTVSDAQAEVIRAALAKAKGDAPFIETGNENSNGNALARICETYVG